jgi:hypothetical protein
MYHDSQTASLRLFLLPLSRPGSKRSIPLLAYRIARYQYCEGDASAKIYLPEYVEGSLPEVRVGYYTSLRGRCLVDGPEGHSKARLRPDR